MALFARLAIPAAAWIDAVIAEEPVSSLRDAAWTSYRERLQLPAVLFRNVTLAIVERRLGYRLDEIQNDITRVTPASSRRSSSKANGPRVRCGPLI